MNRCKPNSSSVKNFLKSLPSKPGIYLISCTDETTYLGATKNLRKRASSHLSYSGRFHSQKFHVIETMETYDSLLLRKLEFKYLRAFKFEHNSPVASPYPNLE